jgi:hypothetical protein
MGSAKYGVIGKENRSHKRVTKVILMNDFRQRLKVNCAVILKVKSFICSDFL